MADEDPEQEGISFTEFIYWLGTMAAMAFGDVADPETGERAELNLASAARMIDIIAMLQAKTQGNLGPEESKFIADLLYDLRMRFVQAQQQGGRRIIEP